MLQRIRQFTDSTNFTKAIIVTVASVLPVLIFSYLGKFEIGFTIAIGAILTYPSDIPSNLEHRIRGLLAAVIIISSCTLFVNIIHPYLWLFYPLSILLVFFLSMISVYGQRATMVSFSGLLAVALATGHVQAGSWNILTHSLLILSGGLIYTGISVLFNYFSPHRYTELQMAECLKLTAKYMKLRGDLWNMDANRRKIIEKQLYLQIDINTIHENLREVLIRTRSNAGNSNRNRKMLLVFISLVDILELALSTSFDHQKLQEKFSSHPKVLHTYQNLAYNLASALRKISKSLQDRKKYISQHQLLNDLESLEHVISEYEEELGKDAAEGVLMLSNMLHYAEKQIEKIKVIERAFTLTIKYKDLVSRDKDLEKFLTPEYYPFSTLKENLSFSSVQFRHSLRLTITIAIGFIIGEVFPLQNVYWILLTIIVIMRPGYGLTKTRSLHRIIGTVLGGVIAFAFLSVIHDKVLIGILSIICMLLGFTFTAINYRLGAMFVTIYVVFVYGLLNPNIMDVVQHRIIDTIVGGALAFTANYFFWPSWEFKSVPAYVKKSIEANRNYLNEISLFYNNKGNVSTSYKLARKNAFVEIGNLMSSYQRMLQEPRSKQKQHHQIYKLAILNHTLLSSLASLGTYIQSHKTTSASQAFNKVVNAVSKNLDRAIAVLSSERLYETENNETINELTLHFTELKNIRTRELELNNTEDFKLKMEEAQLVIEQLVWLNNISEKILKTSRQIKS